MLDVCPSVIHLTVVDVVMQIEGVHPIQGRTTHILWFLIYGTVSKLCIHFMSLLAMGVISGVRPPLSHVLLTVCDLLLKSLYKVLSSTYISCPSVTYVASAV